MNKTVIKAEVVADSINQQGDRLTSLKITFPRIILAEINTHRMLCLAGDTKLEFDLPSPATGSTNYKSYKMTIKEFVDKWEQGAKKRKVHSYEVCLEDKNYTAKEISEIIKLKHVTNIRARCRDNSIKVQNPNKKRNEDFIINGLDYNKYHNAYEKKGHCIKSRLQNMRIRILNEHTGLIEHSTVKDCFISGVKVLYELTLEDGKTLKCSENHRILTEEGWKPLKDITESDFVITQKFGTFEEDKKAPSRHQKYNGLWICQFLRGIKKDIEIKQNYTCKNCINPIVDLHHIIPIHKDITKSLDEHNIIGLCKECHDKEHKNQDWQVSQYLHGFGVKVASIKEVGCEQTYDIEIDGEYPNFIANGIVVHNSKNTSSSRAIPFKKMVEAVQNDPFIPIAWQASHKGMQGTEYITNEGGRGGDLSRIEVGWQTALENAISQAQWLNDYGLTKQLANRLLEPFMWTTMLITGSKEGWSNFFRLRCPQYHYDLEDKYFKSKKEWLTYYKANCIGTPNSNFELDEMDWFNINKGQAEIHMMALAEAIYDAMNKSTPKQLKAGEWHIPYDDIINVWQIAKLYAGFNKDVRLTHIDDYELSDIDAINEPILKRKFQYYRVMVSTAMAARESYTVVGNEKTIDYQKQIDLHNRLLEQDPPHSSPLEHCNRAMTDEEYKSFIKGNVDIGFDISKEAQGWCTNIKGFIPYRYIVDNNLEM